MRQIYSLAAMTATAFAAIPIPESEPCEANPQLQCDLEGNYLHFQRDAGTGYTWCVIAPEISPYAFSEKFLFPPREYLDDATLNMYCEKFLTSQCAADIKNLADLVNTQSEAEFMAAAGALVSCQEEIQALSCQGRENERYHRCDAFTCGGEGCNMMTGPQIECAFPVGICQSGCLCEAGYRRTHVGLCVPENDCGRCSTWNGFNPEPDAIGAFTPKCDADKKSDNWFSVIQTDGSTGYNWCAITPKISHLAFNDKFVYKPGEIQNLDNFKNFCQKLAESECASDLEQHFAEHQKFDADARKWESIDEDHFVEYAAGLASCQNLVESTEREFWKRPDKETVLPELTACHQDWADLETRYPNRSLQELMDDRDVFVPNCRPFIGDYAKTQFFHRRQWCVHDTDASAEPVLPATKFWRNNPKFEQPGFCHRVKHHRCYGKNTRYCKNKICQLGDRNSKFVSCGNECEVSSCQELQKFYYGLGHHGRICPQRCEEGCFCKDGYVFDQDNGKCIPQQFCEVGCNDRKMRQIRKTPAKKPRYNVQAMQFEDSIKYFSPVCTVDNWFTQVQSYFDHQGEQVFYCANNPKRGDLSILPSTERVGYQNAQEFAKFMKCDRLRQYWRLLDAGW